jgi:DNA-binding response OmpR family regulator
MSALKHFPDDFKALGAGANEYVMKPFTQEVILEKLQMLGVAGL